MVLISCCMGFSFHVRFPGEGESFQSIKSMGIGRAFLFTVTKVSQRYAPSVLVKSPQTIRLIRKRSLPMIRRSGRQIPTFCFAFCSHGFSLNCDETWALTYYSKTTNFPSQCQNVHLQRTNLLFSKLYEYRPMPFPETTLRFACRPHIAHHTECVYLTTKNQDRFRLFSSFRAKCQMNSCFSLAVIVTRLSASYLEAPFLSHCLLGGVVRHVNPHLIGIVSVLRQISSIFVVIARITLLFQIESQLLQIHLPSFVCNVHIHIPRFHTSQGQPKTFQKYVKPARIESFLPPRHIVTFHTRFEQ